jgi:LPS-assembly protein
MDFPFNTERKSGLLTPTFGTTTRNGLELSAPYYWNISPNMDATFTPRYLAKRGLQTGVEHRHLGEHHAGISYVEYLPNDNQTDTNRHYFNLNHSFSFAENWSSSVQYEKVSDGQYFTDMSTKVTSTSRVNLPQQASVRYDQSNWHFSALAQRYQTLDNLSFPYQRLPQLSFYGTENLDWADINFNSEFVRFDKHDDAPVTVTGNRTTLYPSISFPFTRSYGYVTPKLGLHYTKYGLSNTGNAFDSASRTLPIFSLDSGLYFDRNMRVVKNRYTQTLEPRLFYVYIPEKDQSRIPNFDTGLSDLNFSTIFSENQFSGGDRINDANQITFAVSSRMIDQKTGTQRLLATIGERFYFSDQEVVLPGGIPRTSSRSDILAALNLQLTNFWYADLNYQYNTQDDDTVRSNLNARYQPENGKVLNLGYRYTADYPGQVGLEQIDISAQWPLTHRWYGLGRLNYSLRENPPLDVRGPIEYIAGLEYNAGCWMGRFLLQRLSTATVTSAARSNFAFFFQLELNGLTRIGSSPLEIIKRNITGYTETSQIPELAP